MRKAVLCLLAAALLLSLLGCAMGDGYGKYANIYKLLDAGDYEGAHAAIDALAGVTTATEPVTDPEVPTIIDTKPAETTVPVQTTAPAVVDPSAAAYVLNTSSMRIHKPNCGSVETIKEGNRKYTNLTLEELIAQGYEPCGRCKP